MTTTQPKTMEDIEELLKIDQYKDKLYKEIGLSDKQIMIYKQTEKEYDANQIEEGIREENKMSDIDTIVAFQIANNNFIYYCREQSKLLSDMREDKNYEKNKQLYRYKMKMLKKIKDEYVQYTFLSNLLPIPVINDDSFRSKLIKYASENMTDIMMGYMLNKMSEDNKDNELVQSIGKELI